MSNLLEYVQDHPALLRVADESQRANNLCDDVRYANPMSIPTMENKLVGMVEACQLALSNAEYLLENFRSNKGDGTNVQ